MSSTPEDTVEELAATAHVDVPGDQGHRSNRVRGLGPLTGLVAAAGFRSSKPVGVLLTTAAILVAANGPMTALGITDPRTWSATDWASDLVPHLVYGVVLRTTMDAFDRP